MAHDEKIERVGDQLIQALVSKSDSEARRALVGKRVGGLDLDVAIGLCEYADDGFRKRAELGLLFLALLDLPLLESQLPEGFWQDIRGDLLKKRPALVDSWNRFARIDASAHETVRAKISLLLEIQFLLLQELQESSSPAMESCGGDIALKVLQSPQPESMRLQVESTAYPLSGRKILAEILSELDFIEEGDNRWDFNLSQSIIEHLCSGANLSAHRAGSAMSQAMVTRLSENLVKRFGFIIRSIGMYPAGHPAIQPSVDSFMNLLDQIMGDSPMVTLTLMGGDLMVNDMQVKKSSRAAQNFIKDMSERNLNSVSIHPGVGSDDVLRFASVFNKPPIYIKEHGGLAKLLERREIKRISIDQFHYALVSDDGTVMGLSTSPEETALEDIIFGELVERLERGDTLRDLPNEKVGEALKKVLQDASAGVDRQRNMLASFVAALDPTILERGLLARSDVQRDMAWSAVRRIIKARLRDLSSSDEDVRLEAIEKLMGFALIAIERNKDNTVMQLLDAMTGKLADESSPDCLFAAISAAGTLLERLIARGKLASAELPAQILKQQDTAESSDPDVASARRRALAEARRRIDTPEVADALLQRLMSQNEVVAREAETISSVLPLTNLIIHLTEVFLEPDIKRRARAYRVLKALGERSLPVLHGRLSRLSLRYETQRDPDTMQLIDDEWYIARNVIGIVGELESASSVLVLDQLCYDRDDRIRHRSLVALARVSEEKALDAALHLLEDRSLEVSKAALDMAVKEARFRPGVIPMLIDVYSQRPEMWPDFLNAMEWLLDVDEVLSFIASTFTHEGLLPFGDNELAIQAAGMLEDAGGEEELKILEGYLARVSGLRKRRGIDRTVTAAVGGAIEAIRARVQEEVERTGSSE